jgi:hypothetical protein
VPSVCAHCGAVWDERHERGECGVRGATERILAGHVAPRPPLIWHPEAARDREPPWWWLSFADGTRPEGEQFLGALVMQGDVFQHVLTVSHALGLNPGGEIEFVPIPREKMQAIPEGARNRLLSREDAEAL